jgi:tetratricopeptide (TPR) repeat protein/O-antigen ligase
MSEARSSVTLLVAAMFAGVPLIVWPGLRDYTLGPKLIFWQGILIVLLALWFFRKDAVFRLPRLALPATVYVLVTVVPTPFTLHPDAGYLEASKLITGFVCYLVLSHHLTRSHALPVLSAIVLTAIPIALLGIGDYIGWRPFPIPSAGLPSATFGFRNMAAMYLIQTLPFALALSFYHPGRVVRTLSAVASGLMAAFLVDTRTRGAWAGWILATLLTLLVLYRTRTVPSFASILKERWKYLLFAFALAILLAALPSGMQKQGPQSLDEKKTTLGQTLQSTIQRGGDRGRLMVWKNTLPMIFAHPLLGVGLGNWSAYYPAFDDGAVVTFEAAPERPHNTPLSIWAEAGTVGLMAYVWFCAATLTLGMRHLQSPETRWIAAAGMASFVAILVHGCFSFPNERITPTLFFWLVPGLFAALAPRGKPIAPVLSRAVVAALFVAVGLQASLTLRMIRFDSLLFQAMQSERAGDWQAVATLTESALDQGTFHPEALILRGYALNTIGDYPAALAHYRSAVDMRPNDIQLLNGLAIAAQNLKQVDLARVTYLKALQVVDSPDTRYNLAGLLLQSGHPMEAAEQYEQVARSENPSLDLYYHQSLAYFMAHASEKAERILQQAFSFLPQDADAHFAWIETLYRRHRNADLARDFYGSFVRLWPGNQEARDRAQKRSDQLLPSPEIVLPNDKRF